MTDTAAPNASQQNPNASAHATTSSAYPKALSALAPRSVSLAWPKSVAGEGLWESVPAHFGDPMREQRLLVDGVAAVDLSAREVVQISGPDRLTWLNSMTTQAISQLPPFSSRQSFVLSPHGHIEYDLHLVDDGDALWITTDPGRSKGLEEFLNRMKFMLRVEVRNLTQTYGVIGEPISQESTRQELDERGVIAWVDPWPNLGEDTASYAAEDAHASTAWRWRELIVPREDFAREFGDRAPAGLWALDALRIEAWRPTVDEVDHRTIPHELDLLRTGVHLHKGCYRGQETIARVHNLGRPPRRLAFVHLDGSGHTLPEVGSQVRVSGSNRPVGRLTSVARHYIDGPIGLVVIKRSTPTDVDFDIDGVAAAQTVIVEP